MTDESKFVDKVCLSQDSRFLRPTQRISIVHAQQLHIPLVNSIHLDVSVYMQALAVRFGRPPHDVLVPFFLPR